MTTSELTYTTTDDHELSSTTISPSTTIRHLNDYSTACTCEMICTWESKESKVTSDREEEIRSALVVDKTSLSSTKRKLISAGDDRQSSTIIGYAGAIFISLVLFFIVIGDIMSLLRLLFCNK
ncbi:hypothetical protein FSP39_015347 [Pinctada imbricata]|uniref:Uncharacterized protein n=1 Tax=Pinctada imbricata TaxID=66713 RepID=A0AA88XFW1_PINIB|nr:hypothetical protein FSP39_015347 [Pinctada imbricata]